MTLKRKTRSKDFAREKKIRNKMSFSTLEDIATLTELTNYALFHRIALIRRQKFLPQKSMQFPNQRKGPNRIKSNCIIHYVNSFE